MARDIVATIGTTKDITATIESGKNIEVTFERGGPRERQVHPGHLLLVREPAERLGHLLLA